MSKSLNFKIKCTVVKVLTDCHRSQVFNFIHSLVLFAVFSVGKEESPLSSIKPVALTKQGVTITAAERSFAVIQ
jgi:hypothetical protein